MLEKYLTKLNLSQTSARLKAEQKTCMNPKNGIQIYPVFNCLSSMTYSIFMVWISLNLKRLVIISAFWDEI